MQSYEPLPAQENMLQTAPPSLAPKPLAEKTPAMPPSWHGGWLQGAVWLASPNFGLRPQGMAVDLLVVHSISLPPGVYGADSGHAVQRLMTNTLDWGEHPYFEQIRGLQVSTHFFITRQGVLWQFVSADERAWHAGTSSYAGRENCNDFSIGVELEGLEGLPFEAPQYQALTDLTEAVRARYPLNALQGHEHIAPGRKHDPGSGFEWGLLAQSRSCQGLNLPV